MLGVQLGVTPVAFRTNSMTLAACVSLMVRIQLSRNTESAPACLAAMADAICSPRVVAASSSKADNRAASHGPASPMVVPTRCVRAGCLPVVKSGSQMFSRTMQRDSTCQDLSSMLDVGHVTAAAGGGVLRSPPETHEEALHAALQRGIIGQAEHDTKLKSSRDPTPGLKLVDVPVRSKGGQLVRNTAGIWSRRAGPFGSREEAVKERGNVIDGNNNGRWAANSKASGGGCKQWYHCNGHVDGPRSCPVLLRATWHAAGGGDAEGWYLEVTDRVHHGLEVKQYERKNSKVTYSELCYIRGEASKGLPPKAIKENREDAAATAGYGKRPEGGVEGGCPPPLLLRRGACAPRVSTPASVCQWSCRPITGMAHVVRQPHSSTRNHHPQTCGPVTCLMCCTLVPGLPWQV